MSYRGSSLKRSALPSYFTFLPAIEIAGFPALEFAVAETFGFSCFGFLASLLLFFPLAMVCPSKMQRSNAVLAKRGCGIHHAPFKDTEWILLRAYFGRCRFVLASSIARCCPRDTVMIGDPNIALAAAKSSTVSISVHSIPVISRA